MAKFSTTSKQRLSTCHTDLQRLFAEVIKYYNCKVIEGHRTEQRQQELFESGDNVTWTTKSKHLHDPSDAVDVAPYPIDWKDTVRFYHFGGFVLGIAQSMGLDIRWGGDWDGDTDLHDQKHMDLVHFERRNADV